MKEPLKKWNRETFGNIDTTIDKLEKEVEKVDVKLDAESSNEVLLARRRALASQLDIWYNRKGEFWKQFSREKYVNEVDRNSKYFHTMATIKR